VPRNDALRDWESEAEAATPDVEGLARRAERLFDFFSRPDDDDR
jgi:hypothetical protein